MNNIPIIFNRNKVKRFRDRAARISDNKNPLPQEVAIRMLESLDSMKGDYENILYIGCVDDTIIKHFNNMPTTKLFVSQDISYQMAKKVGGTLVVADEEKMPYSDASFDLVLANLTLHNVNDLPGALLQIRKLLRKDGVFMATIYGTDTLKELRQLLMELESDIAGGAAPRVFPYTDVKTMGALIQRAGFLQPVASVDEIKIAYDSVFDLIADLRSVGESNSLEKGCDILSRKIIQELDKQYQKRFADSEGSIISTFNIINITGLAAFGD